MKILFRIFAAILFIVFFGFALKNTDEVILKFFMGYEIHSPLVLLLLGFFACGAVLGVLAMAPTVFRYRREATKHRKTIVTMEKNVQAQELARTQPPLPDTVAHL
jgi:putative membrane protein